MRWRHGVIVGIAARDLLPFGKPSEHDPVDAVMQAALCIVAQHSRRRDDSSDEVGA